ncbi:conserved hypothetical protein [Altererythrobacter sp. B11]|uniref:hypothetical protein n=1 Tax=Altererythrobacter sp. B11 TaxID=2060312 RepID=UPI000DC6D7F9|nr:hypothetical protein [Altererythrobacter sp. B11]BBC70960.1 conserved hypothetical protein [Altererythrobacter sp. B11]
MIKALPKLTRYVVAGLGPISGAVAQFVLSLLLLRLLTPGEFGSFSFLLTTSFFTAGIWSALFCAPLPALLNNAGPEERERLVRCIFGVNLLAAMIAFPLIAGLGLALGLPMAPALLFAGYAVAFLLRWFARAYAYATGNRLRTMASDLTYSSTLLLGIGTLAYLDITSLVLAYTILLVSVVAGLLPFGAAYLKRQFTSFHPSAFAEYIPIWKSHSGWSLMGIITTEATVNSHVYIVTAVAGPAAYAPIAATALMIRPIGVLQNALVEYERAHMAMDLAAGHVERVFKTARQFRWMLLAVLLGTAAAVAGMFLFAPNLVFPPTYPLATMATGSALWMCVAGLRLIRAPEATMLQAGGAFRRLAWASAGSCGFSIATVFLLLFLVGPLWSIGGIILGETAFCIWIVRQSLRWRAEVRGKATNAASEVLAPS